MCPWQRLSPWLILYYTHHFNVLIFYHTTEGQVYRFSSQYLWHLQLYCPLILYVWWQINSIDINVQHDEPCFNQSHHPIAIALFCFLWNIVIVLALSWIRKQSCRHTVCLMLQSHVCLYCICKTLSGAEFVVIHVTVNSPSPICHPLPIGEGALILPDREYVITAAW